LKSGTADELAQSLDKTSRIPLSGFIHFGTTIMNDTEIAAADHDGVAVVLLLQ
jgi:hypothetical protein